MFLYAAAIFCSAFLLFLLQPLIGKYILPWFGGGPGVWTTCLLFFQAVLLAGYAYAHFLTQRLRPRRQVLVHLALLAVALALLPVTPAAQWKPLGTTEPVGRILLLLAATIGLPYLVLSATGPLLQWWFGLTHPGVPPYRLYALSNAGSLLALAAYPFFLEPRFARGELSLGWSAGLGVFAVLCAACARGVWRADAPADAAPSAPPPAEPPPPALHRLLWLALPAVASLQLVATTNKLCLDLAALPFLWVLPLGIYLLTFIVSFDHPRWYRRGPAAALLALACCVTAAFLDIQGPPVHQQIAVHLGTLAIVCLVCHGELHALRPSPRHLTCFYLALAAGGAAGSLFVALGAPLLFSDYRELQLGLVLAVYTVGVAAWARRSRALVLGLAAGTAAFPVVLPLLRADAGEAWTGWFASFGRELAGYAANHGLALAAGAVVLGCALREGRGLVRDWRPRLLAVPALLTLLLAATFVRQARDDGATVHAAERNFYGAYKVHLYDQATDPATHFLILANGGITHGLQFRGGPQMLWPTTYYSATSGLGRAFAVLPGGPRRIGAVGLGTGTIAAYGRPGDRFRFYEINPAVVGVASRTFGYLKNTRATVAIALGDARLTLEQELRTGPSPQFDLLVLDAFSGDAIPVHLLTREALALYRRALRRGGLLAIHISNRNLDLRPAVAGLARDAGLGCVTIADTVPREHWWLHNTVWMLLGDDPAVLARPEIRDAAEAPDAGAPTVLWTDDHASLLEVWK